MTEELKPIELGVKGIESAEGVGAQSTPEVKPFQSYTKEKIDELNAGCKAVLVQVLDFLEIKYGLITTDLSQSGSGENLQLNCKWAFEHLPDGKMYKGSFFFTKDDKPTDAKQIIAMQVTLGGNPMGAGYYIMADVMARHALPDANRNSPPELMVRAVIADMVKSGKISFMQAPGALAQVLHIEQNINEAYDINPLQAAQAKAMQAGKPKIQIARR
jgi:hypothetical protein